MTNKQLNEKIAKWIGWEYHPKDAQSNKWHIPRPYNTWTWDCPNFTDSMDACIKWIIPKLKVITITNGYKDWTVSINTGFNKYTCEQASTMSEAVCFALVKLIDNEK